MQEGKGLNNKNLEKEVISAENLYQNGRWLCS